MEAQQQRKIRSCSRNATSRDIDTPRGSKQICIPMTKDLYQSIWHNSVEVRHLVDSHIKIMPEVFPPEIQEGYQLAGRLPESKKMPGIQLRQLRLLGGQGVFTLRPSFVMSYMTGTVENVEHPLMLLAHGVACWLVAEIFGHDEMHWNRHLERLGRNSLVGTTVRIPARLPEHLAAAEHHADWCGEKGFVAFTAGAGCVLGMALSASADEEHLTRAYGAFAAEAREVNPDYAPKSVNTDGWFATRNAFRNVFPMIVTVLCFLHGFLKIRDRCRKARELHHRIWEVYRAATSVEFHERMAVFQKWFEQGSWPKAVMEVTAKLWTRGTEYAVSYTHPGCHRTSNMVDRLMNRLTRFLYAGRGLHGHQSSSELRLRGWALLQNFCPFARRSGKPREYQSPAHRLNQRRYHEHWLHNLQVCASMAGRRGYT